MRLCCHLEGSRSLIKEGVQMSAFYSAATRCYAQARPIKKTQDRCVVLVPVYTESKTV